MYRLQRYLMDPYNTTMDLPVLYRLSDDDRNQVLQQYGKVLDEKPIEQIFALIVKIRALYMDALKTGTEYSKELSRQYDDIITYLNQYIQGRPMLQ
jgi:hypothetical protein